MIDGTRSSDDQFSSLYTLSEILTECVSVYARQGLNIAAYRQASILTLPDR